MAYIELSQSNFFHNLDIITAQAGSKDKIAIVLKDNAYGHGLSEIAGMAQTYGIKHAIVRTLFEAQTVLTQFETILVLADTPVDKPASHVHITINDLTVIPKLLPQTKVELKIDTGMHRNGITEDLLEDALEKILEARLSLSGVFTHHKSADTLSSEYFWQKKNFESIKKRVQTFCEQNNITMPRVHSLNSAGLFRETAFDEDIVRVGIAAYGLLQMQTPLTQPNLKPLLSLWAEKIHEFEANPSQKMGYNGQGTVTGTKRIATYDVGYGDGLLRLNDTQSYSNSDGISLLGRVSMDNIILDTTHETVCLIDNANSYALSAQTISYEVTTRLAPHLKRKIVT